MSKCSDTLVLCTSTRWTQLDYVLLFVPFLLLNYLVVLLFAIFATSHGPPFSPNYPSSPPRPYAYLPHSLYLFLTRTLNSISPVSLFPVEIFFFTTYLWVLTFFRRKQKSSRNLLYHCAFITASLFNLKPASISFSKEVNIHIYLAYLAEVRGWTGNNLQTVLQFVYYFNKITYQLCQDNYIILGVSDNRNKLWYSCIIWGSLFCRKVKHLSCLAGFLLNDCCTVVFCCHHFYLDVPVEF